MSRRIVALGFGSLLILGTVFTASDAFAQRASGQTLSPTLPSGTNFGTSTSSFGSSRTGSLTTLGTSSGTGTPGGHQGASFPTSSSSTLSTNRGR